MSKILLSDPRASAWQTASARWWCVCVCVSVWAGVSIRKAYQVHHIKATGSSITAHSPHIIIFCNDIVSCTRMSTHIHTKFSTTHNSAFILWRINNIIYLVYF